MYPLLAVIALIAIEPLQDGASISFTRQDLPLDGEPSAVVAADVTEDGWVDLVVATGRVSVLIGDGAGGFTEGASVPAGENPVDLAAADFDEDGHIDLAVANHETRYLTLLLGDGTGHFEPAPGSPLTIDVAPHPHAVVAADVDEDGHVDLLVDHRQGEGVLVLRGRGDGRFQASGLVAMGGDPYRGLAVADLNRDGLLDLLVPLPRGVGIALGDGRGEFQLLPELRTAVRSPFAVTTGDVNGDGLTDVGVGSGESADAVAVLLGDGNGAFQAAAGSPFRAGVGGKKIAAADLDDDGYQDLLVTSWNAPRLTILFGGQAGIRSERIPVGQNPWAVATADLDRDGKLDIVVGNSGDRTLTILLSAPTASDPR